MSALGLERAPTHDGSVLGLLCALLATPAIDAWLSAPFPPADGFDRPRGGAPRALAHGRVASVDPLVVEHIAYDNHHRLVLRARYSDVAGLTVREGQAVRRGERLGQAGKVILEGAGGPVPRGFFDTHARLFVPQAEEVLVVIDADAYALALVRHGKRAGYEVGFGQAQGAKERRGDLRTPRGMYFVTEKMRGEFPGEYGAYYGGHWIKVNYPNAADARRGLERGWIDRRTADEITRAWRARALTNQKTRLGGGIGLHGWIREWSRDDSAHLSWGCVVMHLRDAPAIFAALPVGAMVVIF